MNPEKLAQLQASVRIGGKGTPRRKVKKVSKPAAMTDDKKLVATLTKLDVQPVSSIEEVNMFRNDGKVIHFPSPKVQASFPSNTFVINGEGQVRELTQLVPGILSQLGPESLRELQKFAENFQKEQAALSAKKQAAAGKGVGGGEGEEEEDDIPELVETFDSAANEEEEK